MNSLTFNPGGEECHCELRSACKPLRAHSIFSSTSSSLHSGLTHLGYDEVTRENHGTDSVYTCAFGQDNEGDANQSVYSIDMLFLY